MSSSKETDIALWKASDFQIVPSNALTADAIVPYARQLSKRETSQIVQAYESGSYEMGATFVWTKAMMSLKHQLETLGVEFIGEMLERPDFTATTSVVQSVTDYKAIRLAEELGAFGGRQAMRLRHALEVITHAPDDQNGDEEMTPEEAFGCLRACVQTILSQDQMGGAIEFVEFRQQLESRTFAAKDPEVELLASSSYFFKKTTLRVLLALLKTVDGARLQHVAANIGVFLPPLWKSVLDPDKWAVGRTYAESHAAGRKSAAEGVKRALISVKGFDFVPENLRSSSYISVANRIVDAHFSCSNYANEVEPTRTLASLGTAIPPPAFDRCMTALLCVRLGNRYGESFAASGIAKGMLEDLRPDQWLYYLRQCLLADSIVLDKLSDPGRMVDVWIELIQDYGIKELGSLPQEVRLLVDAADRSEKQAVVKYASRMRRALAPG